MKLKLSPCRYCKITFSAAALQHHEPRCPERPTTFRPWRLITCRYCQTELSIRQFQRHLKTCSQAPTCTLDEKFCTTCQDKKPLSAFITDHRSDYCCIACNQSKATGWYADPDNREARRYAITKRLYGVDEPEYTTRLQQQGGVCAICQKPPIAGNSKTDHLHVDHDHATGKVRGLLCYRCNHGLGSFGDNVDLLWKAVSYLDLRRIVPVEEQD